MRNKFKKTLAGILLVTSLTISCNEKPIFKGKILEKSFYEEKAFLSNDRYTALVEIAPGKIVPVVSYGVKARVCNLKYKVGDSLNLIKKYKRGDFPYEIICK